MKSNHDFYFLDKNESKIVANFVFAIFVLLAYFSIFALLYCQNIKQIRGYYKKVAPCNLKVYRNVLDNYVY